MFFFIFINHMANGAALQWEARPSLGPGVIGAFVRSSRANLGGALKTVVRYELEQLLA